MSVVAGSRRNWPGREARPPNPTRLPAGLPYLTWELEVLSSTPNSGPFQFPQHFPPCQQHYPSSIIYAYATSLAALGIFDCPPLFLSLCLPACLPARLPIYWPASTTLCSHNSDANKSWPAVDYYRPCKGHRCYPRVIIAGIPTYCIVRCNLSLPFPLLPSLPPQNTMILCI